MFTGIWLLILLALALPLGYHADNSGGSDSPEIDYWLL